MTNKEYFFDNKEDYLTFKKQWASAVQDKRAKKELIRGSYGAYQKKGWITATHHLIYNIVRDKASNRGFTLITNKNKLESTVNNAPDYAFQSAEYNLRYIQRNPESNFAKQAMEPFGETLSLDKLRKWSEPRHR